jgi:hypothetical protein
MDLLLLLSSLSGMLSVALASSCAAEDYMSTRTDPPLALVYTYTKTKDCDVNKTEYCQLPIYEDGKCMPFPEGTQTLRVVESDKGRLRYNSRKLVVFGCVA